VAPGLECQVVVGRELVDLGQVRAVEVSLLKDQGRQPWARDLAEGVLGAEDSVRDRGVVQEVAQDLAQVQAVESQAALDSVRDRGAVQEVAQDLARVQVVESQAALGSVRGQEAVVPAVDQVTAAGPEGEPAAERALFLASSPGWEAADAASPRKKNYSEF
jgi:hypothetical protein